MRTRLIRPNVKWWRVSVPQALTWYVAWSIWSCIEWLLVWFGLWHRMGACEGISKNWPGSRKRLIQQWPNARYGQKPAFQRGHHGSTRLAQFAGRPHKLTWPRIWSSKRVGWDSRDKNAVNGVSWGKKGQFLASNVRSASRVSSYEAVFPDY